MGKKKKMTDGHPLKLAQVRCESDENPPCSRAAKAYETTDLGVTLSGPVGSISSSVSYILGNENSASGSGESLKETIAKNSKPPENANQVFDESSKKPANQVFDESPETLANRGNKVRRSRTQELKLEAFESMEEEVVLEAHDIDDVQKAWGYCLIGYFGARFPDMQALLQLYDSWRVKFNYFVHPSGWLVFKFKNEADRDSVLKGGPYFVLGGPLLMKTIPTCFEFDDEEIKSVPVWIKLPGLPLECWNATALGKITSKVGTPLYMDKLTHTKKNELTYARVLVEVDASKELVRTIQIKLPIGKTREQTVIYEYEPKFCSGCKVIGHSSQGCTANNQETGSKSAKLKHKDPTAISLSINTVTDMEVVNNTGTGLILKPNQPTQHDQGCIANKTASKAAKPKHKNPTLILSSKNTVTDTEIVHNVETGLILKPNRPTQHEAAKETPFTEVTQRMATKNIETVLVDGLQAESSKKQQIEVATNVSNMEATASKTTNFAKKHYQKANKKDKRKKNILPMSSG